MMYFEVVDATGKIVNVSMQNMTAGTGNSIINSSTVAARAAYNNKDLHKWDFTNEVFVVLTPAEMDLGVIIDSQYLPHELEGIKYFRKKRVEIISMVLTAEITENDALFITSKLKHVKNEVVSGDWKSGRYEMDKIVVEGAYTQTMHDAIYQELTDYIDNNY